jgi:hypothetical protein
MSEHPTGSAKGPEGHALHGDPAPTVDSAGDAGVGDPPTSQQMCSAASHARRHCGLGNRTQRRAVQARQ